MAIIFVSERPYYGLTDYNSINNETKSRLTSEVPIIKFGGIDTSVNS